MVHPLGLRAGALFPLPSSLNITSDLIQVRKVVTGQHSQHHAQGLRAALIVLAGILATHLHLGQLLLQEAEEWLQRVPVVRSVYLTIKSMTDLFQFRSRFNRSTVVVFPFPRDGLWALGFVMGMAPRPVQVLPSTPLMMVFVPTAIHPFTGYLAFIPEGNIVPISLPPEEAMKIEFSAGLYQPAPGWLSRAGTMGSPQSGS